MRARAGQNATIQKLKAEIVELKAEVKNLTYKVNLAATEKDLAVHKRELELQLSHYKAVEAARKEGGEAAIKSLKELRSLTQMN